MPLLNQRNSLSAAALPFDRLLVASLGMRLVPGASCGRRCLWGKVMGRARMPAMKESVLRHG